MAGTIEEIIRPILEGPGTIEDKIQALVAEFQDAESSTIDYFLVFNPGMKMFKVRAGDINSLPNQNWSVVPKSNKIFYSHSGNLKTTYRLVNTWRP